MCRSRTPDQRPPKICPQILHNSRNFHLLFWPMRRAAGAHARPAPTITVSQTELAEIARESTST
jgi:hypothetical protein